MRLKSNLSSMLSVAGFCLVMSGSAMAANLGNYDVRGAAKDGVIGYKELVPSLPVGPVSNGNDASQSGNSETIIDYQYAQADDATYRVNQLEEQVRQLNGRIEEMSYQILQMQEMMRKMQEDTDFRLQELEEQGEKQGSLESGKDANEIASNQSSPAVENAEGGGDSLGKLQPSESDSKAEDSGGQETAALSGTKQAGKENEKKMIDGVELYDPDKDSGKTTDGQKGKDSGAAEQKDGAALNPDALNPEALKPEVLGTLTFDEDGNVVNTTLGKPLDLNADLQTRLEADQAHDSPDELYELGYSYIQAGNYVEAAKSFSSFIEEFPNDSRISDAMFWKGEALFAQEDFQNSAKVFLENHKKWPNSRLGAQNMLKLGLSLAGMNQRELACATYAKIGVNYPDMSPVMKQKVVVEQNSAKCTVN